MPAIGDTATHPIGTNFSALNGVTLPSDYFYSSMTSGSVSQSVSNAGSSFNLNVVGPYVTAGLSGAVSTDINAGSITISGTTYQVYGASADGSLLAFGTGSFVTSNNPVYLLSANGGAPAGTNHIDSTSAFAAPACFSNGTKILTARGEVQVEDLVTGDLAVTGSGEKRRIAWVGYRSTNCLAHFQPASVLPVRIRAHAFADGMPARDLLVSPGHALLVGDVLINAGELVNGGTIVQEEAERVDYYHVELDSHDILIAEGMPCESYLDDGNRASFLNGADHIALHGRIDRASEATCRPLVKSGPLLVAARTTLLARAQALGWELCEQADLRLRVGAEEIAPIAQVGRSAWFLLPAAHDGAVRLRAAAAIVNRIAPDLADDRRLGVAIAVLRVDGVAVALDDPTFGDGCYPVESDGCESWRWTDGDAVLTLPAGTRMVEVRSQIVLPTLQRADAEAVRAAA